MEEGKTWIVAVDGARAQVFEERVHGGPLHPLPHHAIDADTPDHPAAHDRKAAVRVRTGLGDRPMTRIEERRFLIRVARALDAAAEAGAFERLVLLAPARALAALRADLAPPTADRLEVEASRDRSSLAQEVLRESLQAARIAH